MLVSERLKYLLWKCFNTTFTGLSGPISTFVSQDDQILEDSKTLGDCGFTNQTARPQAPATVGLAFRINGMHTLIFSYDFLKKIFLRNEIISFYTTA